MQVIFAPISMKDVVQLQELALKTFIQSYQHLNSPANFQWYIQRAFTNEKLQTEILNRESYYYFVKLNNDIIGYLKLNVGSSQTELHADHYLEIERIYLDTKHKRKGIGRQMIQFALSKARDLKKAKIWLGVWDENPQAILFYENLGFRKSGNHIFRFGDEDQTDIIMELDVSIT